MTLYMCLDASQIKQRIKKQNLQSHTVRALATETVWKRTYSSFGYLCALSPFSMPSVFV